MEKQVPPKFVDKGFEAAAVYCSSDSESAESTVFDKGLTYPMLLDFESEVFRHDKKSNWVFPLHAVIDRKGKLRHLGASLEETETAIAAIIDE